MPARRMSYFDAVGDVQDWLLGFSIYQSYASLESMYKDPKHDYKMIVFRHKTKGWLCKFIPKERNYVGGSLSAHPGRECLAFVISLPNLVGLLIVCAASHQSRTLYNQRGLCDYYALVTAGIGN